MRDPRFNSAPAWARQCEITLENLEQVRAEAREIAAGPAAYERITRVWEEPRYQRPSWWDAFHAEFVAAVREDPARQQAWADTLEEDVVAWSRAFPNADKQSRTSMWIQAAADDWQSEKDPFSVWGHPSGGIAGRLEDQFEQALGEMNLLLQIHPRRGLHLCDTLPAPGMMEGVFYWGHDVRQDRELIETLLVTAPIAFDNNGAWKPGRSVAALLVTDLIVEHAQKLHDAVARRVWEFQMPAAGADAPVNAAEQALREVETTELPGWMRRAFGILLKRTDGRVIAVSYLAHLVARVYGEQSRVAGQEKRWSAFELELGTLCEVLVATDVSISEVRAAWIRAEQIAEEKERDKAARRMVRPAESRKRKEHVGEGARKLHGRGMSYLWGAALMLGDNPRSHDELAPLWSWFEELLMGRDPGLSIIERGSAQTEAAQCFGLLLSRLNRPADIFHKTYDRLEPQRRRSQHGSRSGRAHQKSLQIVALYVSR